MNIAVAKEINREYVAAIELYENEIKSKESSAPLESYINLAFLYWSFAFEVFEFNIPNNIIDEWSIIGGNKYPKILESGLSLYPDSLELHFWKRYFSHISFGEEFSERDCERMITTYKGDDSIVPYFYQYLFNAQKYGTEKNKLLEACQQQPTAKNLYIISVIG